MVRSLCRSQSVRTSALTAVSCLLLAASACGSGLRDPAVTGEKTGALVRTTSVLGTAQAFAVLAGSTVTNTGPTVVNDNVGVNPGSAITGFPPGMLTAGTLHSADALSLQAQNDATAAYLELAARPCQFILTGQDLGGKTLKAGVYCYTSEAKLTGTLVLDAENRADAIFVFKVTSQLTVASNASLRLINGATPCNVFWQIGSSAVIGTRASFVGNILALTSISLATGASLDGRALARTGEVTLDSNRISDSTCQDTAVSACCDDASVCSATCVNTKKDANNCGACGTHCKVDEYCTAGACVGCGPDRAQCKEQCADLKSDPFNCGACGNTCAASESCTAGVCSTCEATVCGNVCVETKTDRENCGACGNTCDTGQCCRQGACTLGTAGAAFCQHG